MRTKLKKSTIETHCCRSKKAEMRTFDPTQIIHLKSIRFWYFVLQKSNKCKAHVFNNISPLSCELVVSSLADYARNPDINKIPSPISLHFSPNINLITTSVRSFKSKKITNQQDKPMNRSLLPRVIAHLKTELTGNKDKDTDKEGQIQTAELFTMTNPRTEACSLPSMAHPITMLLALIKSSLRTFRSSYDLKFMLYIFSSTYLLKP